LTAPVASTLEEKSRRVTLAVSGADLCPAFPLLSMTHHAAAAAQTNKANIMMNSLFLLRFFNGCFLP